MNILYIIGNGFDLAQDLRTKYEHFYPYYQQCESPNNAVKLLKKEINEKVGDWSDMELALGKFSKNITSDNEFMEMYFDLSEKLSDYLSQESKKKQFSKNTKIVNDFCLPFHYLEPLDQRYYMPYYNSLINNIQRVTIDVITLNYTDTIEKLTGYLTSNFTYIGDVAFNIGNICHRHGVLGDTILLGVDNEQQISNEAFKKNQTVKNLLSKPMALDAMRSDNDVTCKELINNAKIIVLYGVSLGETDASLWKDVVRRFSSKDAPLLVYFHYSTDHIPQNRKQLLGTREDQTRKYLYERMGIPETLQSKERILVGYDKDIFKMPAAKTK